MKHREALFMNRIRLQLSHLITNFTTIKIVKWTGLKISFIFSFLLTTPVHAELTSESQCQPTPKITELVGEVRDQKDVGWCFANSGADLLTASYRDLLPPNAQVSSSFVALNFYRFAERGNENKSLPFRYGGSTFLAIDQISKKSFQNKDSNKVPHICLQSVDKRMILQGVQNTSLEQKFKHFQKIYENFQAYKAENNLDRRTQILNVLENSKAELISKKSFLSDYNHSEIINALNAPTFDEAVVQVLEIVCRDSSSEKNSVALNRPIQFEHYYSTYLLDANKTPTVWDTVQSKPRSDFDYINYINKHLDTQKPVSISYNVENVLFDKKSASGAHASTVIDRKYENNECHYFVRNSWGKKCSENKFVQEYKNGKLSTERKNVSIYKYQCEEGRGGFWVPETHLKKLILEVIAERVSE